MLSFFPLLLPKDSHESERRRFIDTIPLYHFIILKLVTLPNTSLCAFIVFLLSLVVCHYYKRNPALRQESYETSNQNQSAFLGCRIMALMLGLIVSWKRDAYEDPSESPGPMAQALADDDLDTL